MQICLESIKKRIQENNDKLKKSMPLPYLVSNVAEILDPSDDKQEEDGATADMSTEGRDKTVVIKTTTRQVHPVRNP